MKCGFYGSTERIEIEFPKGNIFGTRCNNNFCLGGVVINIIFNPYVQPPFPNKRERKRFLKERKNSFNGN